MFGTKVCSHFSLLFVLSLLCTIYLNCCCFLLMEYIPTSGQCGTISVSLNVGSFVNRRFPVEVQICGPSVYLVYVNLLHMHICPYCRHGTVSHSSSGMSVFYYHYDLYLFAIVLFVHSVCKDLYYLNVFMLGYKTLPVATTSIFMITKESELHHSIGSPIDGAHPGPKTDRGGCRWVS